MDEASVRETWHGQPQPTWNTDEQGPIEDRQWISPLLERAAGHPHSVGGFQPPPDLATTHPSGKQTSVGPHNITDDAGGFVEKLNAEVPHSRRLQGGNRLGRALRHGVEERVATAHVGREGMRHPDPIAEFDQMLVAGTATVVLIRSGRKHGAEDTVLHVEHRHVLVDDNLQTVSRRQCHQGQELLPVEIVGGRHPAAAGVDEELS